MIYTVRKLCLAFPSKGWPPLAEAVRTKHQPRLRGSELAHGPHMWAMTRVAGADASPRMHMQAFYRKLFANPEVRHYFESLPPDRMRAKQVRTRHGTRTHIGPASNPPSPLPTINAQPWYRKQRNAKNVT